jgi:hypothetical protein
MKKAKQANRDELRAEYKPSDFPGGLVREKYASRLRKSSNIVVLRPEVAEAFPNEEAVNKALLSPIDVAKKTTGNRKACPLARRQPMIDKPRHDRIGMEVYGYDKSRKIGK